MKEENEKRQMEKYIITIQDFFQGLISHITTSMFLIIFICMLTRFLFLSDSDKMGLSSLISMYSVISVATHFKFKALDKGDGSDIL